MLVLSRKIDVGHLIVRKTGAELDIVNKNQQEHRQNKPIE